MERQAIFNGIKDILDKYFEIERVNLTESTNLCDDLGADSIDVVSIAIDIDRKFKIETQHEEIEDIWADLTVGYLIDMVQRKMLTA